jgi:hypothetical protein
MLHELCYAAAPGEGSPVVDETLSTLLTDDAVPQNLVSELYPLDYKLMVDVFVDALTGPDAAVHRENLKFQYTDAMRMMDDLNYVWIGEHGAWNSPVIEFDVPRAEAAEACNRVKSLLEDVYLSWDAPGKVYSESKVKSFKYEAELDAEKVVYFLMNIAAGEAYGERVAVIAAVEGNEPLKKNIPYLCRFFESILIDTTMIPRFRRRRAATNF